ncbi:hypothetical protein [Devosia ginsengisoli]|uniref:hypothetical protein n=1 Tax=Devosia ginsengisoli TaxID=400770 RepID=UPI0026EA75CB|nr:hypothetical protein [Devosia ginsengisoli]MCR6673660.1 hypothetical protein [Devosia ginsengisoli]
MLIRSADLDAIWAGRVDILFRRWTRPTVKTGGTLVTAKGVLAIDAVDVVALAAVSADDLSRAGFADLAALETWLDKGKPGVLHRIKVRPGGADPRIALRESMDDLDAVEPALARLDAREAWTEQMLLLIEAHPGRLAQSLADEVGLDKLKLKARVRQLKALGLTESLEIGYRLAPRGAALLARRRSIASA